ncbi:MAG: ABC transporter permease, partial [Actinobacteria bacterium]|nr:ABC transporter permease [Actinomycetota bacterium]
MARREPATAWGRALRTPTGGSAAVLVALLVAIAIVAPLVLGGRATHIDVSAARHGISARHWLGTDGLGRDILARVLVATRLSLLLAVAATLVSGVIGVVLGALPAVTGRTLGRLLAALVNLLVAFPGLLLALFLVVVFGVGERGAVLAIGLAGAPGFARFTQTLAASVAGADYVAAARILGIRRPRILARHVLPNIAEPLVIVLTISVGAALVSFAGLSFLGFGVQPPSYDWGQLLNDGLSSIFTSPAPALAPGVAVVLAGVAFSLLGETAAAVAGIRVPQRWLGPGRTAAALRDAG